MSDNNKTVAAAMGQVRPHVFKDAEFDYAFTRTLGVMCYAGSSSGECYLAAQRIKNGNVESWTVEWLALAQYVEKQAQAALAAGHLQTARDSFLRVYSYYRTAEFFISPRDPRKRDLYEQSVAAFAEAARLFPHPMERVNIPYEGTSLPGYFMRPADDDQARPTLVLLGGGDCSGEELYLASGAVPALERGYNVLIFDGPGQRGTSHRDHPLFFRHDWEAVMTPVLGWVLDQPGVDPERVALYAISFGGYLGPRALAHDHRWAALIVNSPMTSFYNFVLGGVRGVLGSSFPIGLLGPIVNMLMGVSPVVRFAVEQFRWMFGVETIEEIAEVAERYQLHGIESQITCPVLAMGGEGEGSEFLRQSEEFLGNLNVPHEYRLF
ncbi:MAG: alpha/beta hydrolase, partial [Chloroflexi bacterium]|nr:alpha/beta hydrolase [Chloroflexota bacterium]